MQFSLNSEKFCCPRGHFSNQAVMTPSGAREDATKTVSVGWCPCGVVYLWRDGKPQEIYDFRKEVKR